MSEIFPSMLTAWKLSRQQLGQSRVPLCHPCFCLLELGNSFFKKIICCSPAYSSYCSIFSVSFLELFQRLIYTCCDPFIYFSLFLLFPLGFPTHHSTKRGRWRTSHQMKWSLSPYLPCRHSQPMFFLLKTLLSSFCSYFFNSSSFT